MYSELWEREPDAFFIKCRINNFIDIIQNTPIISTFYPDTNGNIHTACT